MSKYQFTDAMIEISGFGGGYERCCRKMVVAGLEWWDAHPDADPQFHGYKNIYGIIVEDNDDAKELTKAIIAAAEGEGEATGAQHQATVGVVLWVRANGWDKYVEAMTDQP